jgi:hypothetical protein
VTGSKKIFKGFEILLSFYPFESSGERSALFNGLISIADRLNAKKNTFLIFILH